MFFPTKKTKSLRIQIPGFQQRDVETLHQDWERYKKLLRDCPHQCQSDEVLEHTFVDGLNETSKINLDSTCGGSCMARPYSEIQLLPNNFTANDHNWQGDGESQRALKQKGTGVIELYDLSAMRADIAKLENQMNRMTMNQTQQIQHTTRNHYKPQGNFNQPQKPPQQEEESVNDLLKKLLLDNQQLRTDFRNLVRQMGQLASNKNTRHTGALPSDTEKNPQFNAITLRNRRELEDVPKKRKDKPIPEGKLIPKVQLNIPLVDVLREIPKYAKYIKDILAHKRRLTEFEIVALTEQLGLGAPRPTTMMLQLADRSIAYLKE
ncbi:uncharacterized protein LOC142177104 [Nicotiana tabacum]|uniref:Uncharacterized protein LOC142177104 n=1 Tax=Nicotiana tabacum TaxID=4097 RepID=A0AC58TWR9_TOBAC